MMMILKLRADIGRKTPRGSGPTPPDKAPAVLRSGFVQNNPRGFTLIEVLIAIVVIAVGCLGALHLQSVSMRGGSTADQGTVAAFLAESKLEALRALPITDLTAGTTTEVCTREGICCEKTGAAACLGADPVSGRDHPRYPYEIVTEIVAGEPTSFSHRIAIQISWSDVYGHRRRNYDASVTSFSF